MNRWIRFFAGRKPLLWRIPASQYTQAYDIRNATSDELLLIRSGHARNPIEAKLILARFKGKRAYEIIPLLPRRTPTRWQLIKGQIKRFIMRVEGSNDISPYPKSNKAKDSARLTIRVKYKRD